MQVRWMLHTATILAIASPGLSEVIVEGYAFDDGEKSESTLEKAAKRNASRTAIAYIEGVEFTLTLTSDGPSFQTKSSGTLSDVTTVEKGPLGNGLYRVRTRIRRGEIQDTGAVSPDSTPLQHMELRNTLEPILGFGEAPISASRNIFFARRNALFGAIQKAISQGAEGWYASQVPKTITGRYYMRIVREEPISDSYRVEVEVKVWFSDTRVTKHTSWEIFLKNLKSYRPLLMFFRSF